MNRGILSNINFSLLFPVLTLVTVSLTVIFSISKDLFFNQLIFLGISLFVYILCSNVNYRVLKFYSKPIYFVAIFVLSLLLFWGIESHGAVRWFEFLGFRVQFSEFMKPFLGIALASYLSQNSDRSFKTFVTILLYLLPIALLIFVQPDLGSALIYLFVVILTLLTFGFSFKFFMSGIVLLLIMSPIAWNFLHDYQRNRLLTFINPTSDPLGTSYNAIQSVIAVGSGMLFGQGLGQGTQSALKFLPERHTDFIFATTAEELGFLGTVFILVFFAILLYRIFNMFLETDDTFSKIFISICFFILLVQFFINVGMNIGILPIVGVTLPFVSYGGSSLLSSFIILGFLSAVSKGEERLKHVLEIR